MKSSIGSPKYGGMFVSDRPGLPPGFLPCVLPGEVVESSGTSEAVTILEASPHRVVPQCVHFESCGGCSYQHADYLTQLELKSQILGDLFVEAGLQNLPSISTHHASEWGYRNRIRLRVESVAGELKVGYSRAGSNTFLPIRMCPIASPLLWRAAEAFTELASIDPLCRRWFGSISEAELFCSPDQSRLQLIFFLRDSALVRAETAGFPGFCERLRAAIPELTGAGATLDPELNRRMRRNTVHGRWAGASWGTDGLAYETAGHVFWISRGAFFQVNRLLVDRLVTLVAEGSSGALAWDLFAGVGLFSQALAQTFSRVVAVEGGAIAAADLVQTGRSSPALESVHSSALDFLRAQQHQRERPELVVLDPPRAGLGAEAAAILARIAAPRLVYVSCDPRTLARDLVVLTRETYAIEALHLVDLFPQTFHLETVVHLRKK